MKIDFVFPKDVPKDVEGQAKGYAPEGYEKFMHVEGYYSYDEDNEDIDEASIVLDWALEDPVYLSVIITHELLHHFLYKWEGPDATEKLDKIDDIAFLGIHYVEDDDACNSNGCPCISSVGKTTHPWLGSWSAAGHGSKRSQEQSNQ